MNFECSFIEIFSRVHFPALQKLTLVGGPKYHEVNRIKRALASCHVRVIDFETPIPPNEIDVHLVVPLLSVVREVAVCGEVICSVTQIGTREREVTVHIDECSPFSRGIYW